jgi:hypothetical protein
MKAAEPPTGWLLSEGRWVRVSSAEVEFSEWLEKRFGIKALESR